MEKSSLHNTEVKIKRHAPDLRDMLWQMFPCNYNLQSPTARVSTKKQYGVINTIGYH